MLTQCNGLKAWEKNIAGSDSVLLSLCLPSVFCCRAGSGYAFGYPVLGNSQGGFPLPCSRFVITYCDQSFPSPWHCLSAAPSRCYPLVHSWRRSPIRNLGTRVVAAVLLAKSIFNKFTFIIGWLTNSGLLQIIINVQYQQAGYFSCKDCNYFNNRSITVLS